MACSSGEPAKPIKTIRAATVQLQAPRPDRDRPAEDPEDSINAQISAGTMFCLESAANDCPRGFRCDGGACVAE